MLTEGRFEGRIAFAQRVQEALASAAQDGWRDIIVSDATFEDWPWRERETVELLKAWSKTGRRFTMLATRYDVVQRDQARFVAWRKTWSHIIDCRVCREADPLDFPSALWSPHWTIQRFDLRLSTGVGESSPERRVALKEVLDEHIRNSAPGFAATTLGL